MGFSKAAYGYAAILPLLLVGGTAVTFGPQSAAQAAQEVSADKWSKEVEGFRLSLKSKKESYALGEAIDLDFALKNISGRSNANLPFGLVLNYKLYVTRPDGEVAPLTPQGEQLLAGSRRMPSGRGGVINPGDERRFSFNAIQATFDMTQPGEYQLRLSRQVPTRDDPRQQVTLTSNTVTIRIESERETRTRLANQRRASRARQQNWQSEGKQEVEGLALSLKSEKRRYAPNTPIGLFLTLENRSREDDRDDAFFAPAPGYKLEVLRADGQAAAFTSLGEKTQGVVIPVLVDKQRVAGPGDTQTWQHDPSFYFDMKPPGEYYLRASLAVPRRGDPKQSAILFSNVVRIRIEAPAED